MSLLKGGALQEFVSMAKEAVCMTAAPDSLCLPEAADLEIADAGDPRAVRPVDAQMTAPHAYSSGTLDARSCHPFPSGGNLSCPPAIRIDYFFGRWKQRIAS